MASIGHFSGLILTSAVCLSLEVSSDLNETDPWIGTLFSSKANEFSTLLFYLASLCGCGPLLPAFLSTGKNKTLSVMLVGWTVGKSLELLR